MGTCVSDVPGLSYGTYVYSGNGVLSCLGGNSTGKFTWTWHRSDGSVIGNTVVGLDADDPAVITRVNGNNVAATTADTTGGSIIHPGRMEYTEQLIATDQTACATTGLNAQTGTSLGLTAQDTLIVCTSGNQTQRYSPGLTYARLIHVLGATHPGAFRWPLSVLLTHGLGTHQGDTTSAGRPRDVTPRDR
ncbi:hypothetical protein [Streptomyces sp. ISL-100]|uniref:hypothetical protein n=1 Tax=Streptomyces sp. ISL-100 TaxID=2819173 RepID=UPI001BEADD79|nr:hypothetical protein [Streptomyces sp. ISL-100]MBT2401421.1 hypothetical protein [Streptomyces sp. ISL-100]